MIDKGEIGLPVRYDPLLIEEAVFLTLRGHPESDLYHQQRNRLYEISDPEEHERSFQDLHRSWFSHLGLASQIEKAVAEQHHLISTVKSCVIVRASRKKEEGAELFVNPEERLSGKERRNVRILICPESFLESPPLLLTFLRHELQHITDMLDPGFGYDPVLPTAEGGPTYDRLLQNRYRVLWDATIDGRMVRRGWAPESIRAERLNDFAQAFPMLGNATAQLFGRFFDQESHTHSELIAFARDPRAALEGSSETPHPGSRCPLCCFPTYVFEENPECLPAEIIFQIRRDFPQWRSAQGLCQQCADLYKACTQTEPAPSHLSETR